MFQKDNTKKMSQMLIVIGTIVLLVGILWPWLSRLGLGALPGDIVFERGQFKFYAPLMTSFLLSMLLSIIGWLISRLLG